MQNRALGVQNLLAEVQNLPSREMQFDVIITLYETSVIFLSFFLSFIHPFRVRTHLIGGDEKGLMDEECD